jgi:hypothetical protein
MALGDKALQKLPRTLAEAATLLLAKVAVSPPLSLAQFGLETVLVGLGAINGLKAERFFGRIQELERDRGADWPLDSADGIIRLGLIERGMLSATRADSDERIERVARLVGNGLDHAADGMLRHRHLLDILDDLNDLQVLILVAYGRSGADRDSFWREHEAALSAPIRTRFSEPDIDSRLAVWNSYFSQLRRHGLLDDSQRPSVTQLGRALLRAMDQPADASQETEAAHEEEQKRLAKEFVPVYWAAFKDVLSKGLDRSATQLGLPEPIKRSTGQHDFMAKFMVGPIVPTLQAVASPVDSWIYVSYPDVAAGGGVLPMPRPGPRQVWLRTDGVGTFALVEGQRVYSMQTVADFVIDPVLEVALGAFANRK